MLPAIDKVLFVRCQVLTTVCALIVAVGALPIPATAAEQYQETPSPSDEPAFVEPLTEPMAVIPPGREELLAEMLGRGVTLPGECAFTSGQVERDSVVATYACPTGAVAFTLRHPSKATSDATLTEQFALVVKSGSPPAELTAELAARIRSRERAFEWTWLAATASPRSYRTLVLIITVLLAAGALWLALRRRS